MQAVRLGLGIGVEGYKSNHDNDGEGILLDFAGNLGIHHEGY